MSSLDRARVRALIQDQKTTPRAVSRAISDNPYLVRDILSGKSQNPRSDTLSKLAAHLGVRVADILEPTTAGSDAPADMRLVPKILPIRYRVQAGLWYEVDSQNHFEMLDEERQEFEGRPAVVPNLKYSDWPQWLELICGDSINEKASDGDYAHVVDAIEMGYAAKHADWVVVERRRDQGALRERTIKQVDKSSGRTRLMPRSTNPKWSDPVDYMNGGARPSEQIEVEIVGKVIGFYSPT